MLLCVSLLKLDVFSLNLPDTGMGYLASPWTFVHSCDCGLMARCHSKSSRSDPFNRRGRPTTSSLFLAVPGVFHDEGLSERALCPSVQEHHLQHSDLGKKEVAGFCCALLRCLQCHLLVWPPRAGCGIWCDWWYGCNLSQPFLVQMKRLFKVTCISRCSLSSPVVFF